MVVVRPRLVDCRSAVHSQAAQQPGVSQMSQAIIDSLMRHAWQDNRNNGKQGRRSRVRLRLNRVEYRDALTRDPQSSGPDQLLRFLNGTASHASSYSTFLNGSRKQSHRRRLQPMTEEAGGAAPSGMVQGGHASSPGTEWQHAFGVRGPSRQAARRRPRAGRARRHGIRLPAMVRLPAVPTVAPVQDGAGGHGEAPRPDQV